MSTSTISPAPASTKRGPAENFIGTVWVTMLAGNNPTDCTVADVTFEPGARNNWHSHPAGQLLVVTAGAGYYQEKGEPAQRLRAGDTVSIAPNVVHWHGATADSIFTHLAINPNVGQGAANWLEPVTDEQYRAAHE
ncbi:cupin domain-containing protein [Hymenobacter sp. BT186]|uniref:Cupin domain-containing protein n=2 Tax=Hymenobacter telluris TaxID=2816474 RepID=A0A939JCN7_9BACT|nr:cupin domain-containing protein [Hymenobacter telluris]MBW3374060.1 cupin domain-containing protein [Hymenobacter norwichensis]